MPSDLATLQIQAAAATRLAELEQEAVWRADKFQWAVDHVRLLDPLAPDGQQVRPFPDEPYLRVLFQQWETHKRSITWKPRRMVCSWAAIAFLLGEALLRPHRRIYLIANKLGENDAEGSRELFARMMYLLRDVGRPKGMGASDIGTVHAVFPNGSTVTAVGSHPRQMRGPGATDVLGDEFGTWDTPDESLKALLPTLEDRGRFIGLATSALGYFQRLIYDEDDLEAAVPVTRSTPPAPVETFAGFEEGWLRAWTNPRNGFRVLDLNLGANPRYRGTEAEVRARCGNPAQSVWEQEYRKRFLVRGGTPIYAADFDERRMVVDHLPVLRDEPLLVGLDFGFNCPAAVVAQLRAGLQWRVYRTRQGDGTTLREFVQQLLAKLNLWFPAWPADRIFWCGDVQGSKPQYADVPAFQILRREFQIPCRARGIPDLPTSLERVKAVLQRNVGTEPALLIHRNEDTVAFREGFLHAYRFKRATADDPVPSMPEKGSPAGHRQDAFRYLVENFGGVRVPPRAASLLAIARRDIIPPRRFAF